MQTYVLDEAAKHHPNAWWWLKADGCDVVNGLAESMRGAWSGDVDLNDGELQQQHKAYQDRLARIECMKYTPDREQLCDHLHSIIDHLKEDLEVPANRYIILLYTLLPCQSQGQC